MTPSQSRMKAALDLLVYCGENDMGDLTEHQAGRWHDATDRIRSIVTAEHKHIGVGQCGVCGHYGDDCTGERDSRPPLR